ncbi:MAG: hypothetical protein H7A53_08065 [Akkermansiaceae bacterium]|nr:hypothetical protein [Akkermansiaceae bacterium]
MTKTMIAIPICFSPVILCGILLETTMNDAYPPEADSLGIPLFSYLLFLFPIALYLLSKIEGGRLRRPKTLLWNAERHGFSAVSMILSIFPLGLFWFGYLLIGISSGSIGAIFGSTLLLAATFLVRTFAIQPFPLAEDAGEQLSAGDEATVE